MPEKLIVNAVNQDNEDLHAIGTTRFIIGQVDEVNGAGAVEVAEFVPTRHELLELVKYWTRVALDDQYFTFVYAQTGSTERRRIAFAWRRIDHIGGLLGDEVVDKAVDEATEDFGKTCDPRAWGVFMHGDKGAQRAFQDEVQRELNEHTAEYRNSEGSRPDGDVAASGGGGDA